MKEAHDMTAQDQSSGSTSLTEEPLQDLVERGLLDIGRRAARMFGTSVATAILRDVASQLETDAAIRQAH